RLIIVASAAPIVPHNGISKTFPTVLQTTPSNMYFPGANTCPNPCNIPELTRIKELNSIDTAKTASTLEPSLFANNMILVGFIILTRPTVAPTLITIVIFNALIDFSCKVDSLFCLQADAIKGTNASENDDAATVPN